MNGSGPHPDAGASRDAATHAGDGSGPDGGAGDGALLRPADGEQLAATLAQATARRQQVLVVGQGSRASLGALVDDPAITLTTTALDGVSHYEPGDLTITVGAGMPLASLAELLAAEGQTLPCQPTRRRGTVGGLLASAANGVLDLGQGTVRDRVLGATIAYGDGTLARARGRVVKNVAGYDLPRLMVGSLGTLGALTEVSLRLEPLPARTATLLLGFKRIGQALQAAATLAARPWEPVFLDLLAGACTPQLAVGYDGRPERVAGLLAATAALLDGPDCQGTVTLHDADDLTLRARLDDPIAHLGSGDVPGSCPETLVLRWWGQPPRVRAVSEVLLAARAEGLAVRLHARPLLGQIFAGLAHADPAALPGITLALLQRLRRDGSVVLLAAPAALRADPDTVWGPPPPDWPLMQTLKTALDPGGTLLPGRFVGGL